MDLDSFFFNNIIEKAIFRLFTEKIWKIPQNFLPLHRQSTNLQR